MTELSAISAAIDPTESLLVVDSMTGQDAVNMAKSFNERLEITGIILTKTDGDARGGAALAIKQVTGKPIAYVGMGEGLDKLEEFRPEGLADRILGFGDVVGLMQDFEKVVDEKKAEEDAKKILSGDFNMTTFLEQIRTLKKMGSMRDVLEKMPFFGDQIPADMDDKQMDRVEAIILSMTRQERQDPELLNRQPSRMRRIARGSGNELKEVSGLVQRFFGMRQMMKQVGDQPGLLNQLPGFKQMGMLNRLRGGAMGDMFEGMEDLGMPGMPGMGPAPGRAAAPRLTQAQMASQAADRKRRRAKAKKAAKSRKKNRKK